MAERPRIRLLACGVFRKDFDALDPELRNRFEPHFLDSMLHMHPEALDDSLRALLDSEKARPTLVLYGDCCPYMRELAGSEQVVRVGGDNCAEAFLGSQRYRELKKARSFIFMPEWLGRWKEIFEGELGLEDPGLAREFMQDEMRQLVYVDTGTGPIPAEELEAIGRYFALPVIVETASLGFLSKALEDGLKELEPGEDMQAIPEGPAFELLFSDLVERIMSMADRPSECVSYIAQELRSLVGVKSIFVYECPSLTGEGRHRLVSVLPERRRTLGEEEDFQDLAELTHHMEDAIFVGPEEDSPLSQILARHGIGDSLVLPLRYARTRVGVVLLLDLLDKANVGTILDTLGRMSSVLALILRNAFLYENLEGIVEERTARLEGQKAALKASLAEKDVMLKEIHHRVKNNLQIVNSLLYLRMNTLSDPETKRLFAESQSRVFAMALVHEELYGSRDLASVNMADYISRLAGRLLEMAPPGIQSLIEAEPLGLGIDSAIPCGLILNELLLNAFKHAFVGRSSGRLRIGLHRLGEDLVLEVEDDGPGIDAAPGPPGQEGSGGGKLGLTIVQSLTDQLHGDFQVLPGPGARFRLTFRALDA